MNNSVFDVLDNENLNRLKINYDYKTDKVLLYAGREWKDDLVWSGYNTNFNCADVLSDDMVTLNHDQTRALFRKYNQENYLDEVISLLRKGKHQYIDCYYHKGKNIRFTNNVHSLKLGINNRSQAITAGGIRRHLPSENEIDVIIDGLNLGRGMSFKNFAARIPFGGSKITVIMDELDLNDLEAVGFLSYCVDRSRCFTGPDMNFPTELADVMKKHFSLNITGGPQGPLGATGVPTAYGVYLAAKEASRFRYGNDSLKDKKIAVQGLGALGYFLAEHYINEGAELYVSDIDETVISKLIGEHPDAKITSIGTDEILFLNVDILSPCAIGGIFNHNNIGKLNADIIIGGANNQLKASSAEEEIELADKIKDRGILFQVAWWHNGGGVLCGFEEYTQQENASMDNVLTETRRTCKFTFQNLKEAAELNISPTENAYRQVESYILAKD